MAVDEVSRRKIDALSHRLREIEVILKHVVIVVQDDEQG